jgi:hypothetical protein
MVCMSSANPWSSHYYDKQVVEHFIRKAARVQESSVQESSLAVCELAEVRTQSTCRKLKADSGSQQASLLYDRKVCGMRFRVVGFVAFVLLSAGWM